MSLGKRLMATMIAATFAYWGTVMWVTIHNSIEETYELFDAHLALTAMALLRVSDPDDIDPVELPAITGSSDIREVLGEWPDLLQRAGQLVAAGKSRPDVQGRDRPSGVDATQRAYSEYERHTRYQIWSGQGKLLVRSANAPLVPMSAQDGFSESKDSDGVVWRHFGIWDRHHSFHILVSEAHDIRNRLLEGIAFNLVKPMLIGIPVLILMLWYSIFRGLGPLRLIANQIGNKKTDDLRPIDIGHAPEEIRPIVLALNDLLQNVTRALENERCFTANAAHELRTPLAAIRVHLSVLRAAEDEAERLNGFNQLERSVERGIRLVGQLLTLARLDPEHNLPKVESVHLGDLTEAICADLAPLALHRHQVMELMVEPDLPLVQGNPDLLAMLLSNLVDNAIRYTPNGGNITIDVRHLAGEVLIEVTDDGPGIPAAQRENVFERFCRLVGQNKPGTGLGLAICRRVADLHHARIDLADGPAGRGLTASVSISTALAPPADSGNQTNEDGSTAAGKRKLEAAKD